jgi:hypothetical protein
VVSVPIPLTEVSNVTISISALNIHFIAAQKAVTNYVYHYVYKNVKLYMYIYFFFTVKFGIFRIGYKILMCRTVLKTMKSFPHSIHCTLKHKLYSSSSSVFHFWSKLAALCI